MNRKNIIAILLVAIFVATIAIPNTTEGTNMVYYTEEVYTYHENDTIPLTMYAILPSNNSIQSTSTRIRIAVFNMESGEGIYLKMETFNFGITEDGMYQIDVHFPSIDTNITMWHNDDLLVTYHYKIQSKLPTLPEMPQTLHVENVTQEQVQSYKDALDDSKEDKILDEIEEDDSGFGWFDLIYYLCWCVFVAAIGNGLAKIIIKNSPKLGPHPVIKFAKIATVVGLLVAVVIIVWPSVWNTMEMNRMLGVLEQLRADGLISNKLADAWTLKLQQEGAVSVGDMSGQFELVGIVTFYAVVFLSFLTYNYNRREKLKATAVAIMDTQHPGCDMKIRIIIGIIKKNYLRGVYEFINVENMGLWHSLMELLGLRKGTPFIIPDEEELASRPKVLVDTGDQEIEAILLDRMTPSSFIEKDAKGEEVMDYDNILVSRAIKYNRNKWLTEVKENALMWERLRIWFIEKTKFGKKTPFKTVWTWEMSRANFSTKVRVMLDEKGRDTLQMQLQRSLKVSDEALNYSGKVVVMADGKKVKIPGLVEGAHVADVLNAKMGVAGLVGATPEEIEDYETTEERNRKIKQLGPEMSDELYEDVHKSQYVVEDVIE